MQRVLPILVLALFVVALVVAIFPIPRIGSDDGGNIETKLGLDLIGGLRGEYQVVATDDQEVTTEILEQTRTIVENRVNATGVAEPIVVTQGSDRISVELPGVDDEGDIRASLRMILEYEGMELIEAETGPQAIRLVEEEGPDAVLLDIKMPRMDGLEVLAELKKSRPGLPVVMISGHGTVATAVEATRLGAFDFMEKPLERERVLLVLRNALERGRLEETVREYRVSTEERYRLVGRSDALREAQEAVARIAPAKASVLITGPSFGIGSSREHAVWAIQDRGFEAVVATSFGDIFRNNSYNNGLLPVELSTPEVDHLLITAAAAPDTVITIDPDAQTVAAPGLQTEFAIDGAVKHRLLNGLDDIALALEHDDAIAGYEGLRPVWMPTVSQQR